MLHKHIYVDGNDDPSTIWKRIDAALTELNATDAEKNIISVDYEARIKPSVERGIELRNGGVGMEFSHVFRCEGGELRISFSPKRKGYLTRIIESFSR